MKKFIIFFIIFVTVLSCSESKVMTQKSEDKTLRLLQERFLKLEGFEEEFAAEYLVVRLFDSQNNITQYFMVFTPDNVQIISEKSYSRFLKKGAPDFVAVRVSIHANSLVFFAKGKAYKVIDSFMSKKPVKIRR